MCFYHIECLVRGLVIHPVKLIQSQTGNFQHTMFF